MSENEPRHILDISAIAENEDENTKLFLWIMYFIGSSNVELSPENAIVDKKNPGHFNFYCELPKSVRAGIGDICPECFWVEKKEKKN